MKMDLKIIFMDNLTKHLAYLERKHPSLLPIQTIGFMPRKTDQVRRSFPTYNFSFILEGTGLYKYKSQTFVVQAPMVITQWPGAHLEYGPDAKSRFWKEVYFDYARSSVPLLTQMGFIQKKRFIWKIHSIDKVQEWIMKIYNLCQTKDLSNSIDLLDRFVEQLILVSHENPSIRPQSELDRKFDQIEREIRKSYHHVLNYPEIASRYGMSYTHFRRLWGQRKGTSLARFQSELQIHEACRLLVETTLRISEIAHRVGWEDPLYFSRKFKKIIKKSPQDYRDSFPVRFSNKVTRSL